MRSAAIMRFISENIYMSLSLNRLIGLPQMSSPSTCTHLLHWPSLPPHPNVHPATAVFLIKITNRVTFSSVGRRNHLNEPPGVISACKCTAPSHVLYHLGTSPSLQSKVTVCLLISKQTIQVDTVPSRVSTSEQIQKKITANLPGCLMLCNAGSCNNRPRQLMYW